MAIDHDKLQDSPGMFVGDLGATVAAGNVVIGHNLGLCKALAGAPATAGELAGRTGTSPRYAAIRTIASRPTTRPGHRTVRRRTRAARSSRKSPTGVPCLVETGTRTGVEEVGRSCGCLSRHLLGRRGGIARGEPRSSNRGPAPGDGLALARTVNLFNTDRSFARPTWHPEPVGDCGCRLYAFRATAK
jgi:hypothetical protein